jgi:outer membrane biosynthesis protein TonB
MSFDFCSLTYHGAEGELNLRQQTQLPGGFSCGKIIRMAGAVEKVDSLRLNRFETKRLVLALVLSLLAHFLIWGGYELGKKSGLWQRLHWPERWHLAQKKIPPLVQETEPNIFLDVDPDQATPDAPKDTKYYSSKNSRAGNPDEDKNSNQPKLNGKQTDVPKTKDVPPTPKVKPQEQAQPQPQKEAQPAQPAQPRLTELPGDTKLAKLETPAEQKEPTPDRPRTLKEARAQQSGLFPSMTMKQEGGARLRLTPAFDAKATAFGDYDRQFIDAVTAQWYNLLDSQQFSQDRSGKVTLRFHLNYDGTISDMEVLENTVGELLGYVCQKAVTDPSPYAPWPSDMRHMVGANYREITFTFYYY